MKIVKFFVLALLPMFMSCAEMVSSCAEKNDELTDLEGKVAIRIQNLSVFRFENIVTNIDGKERRFNTLPPLCISKYQFVDYAYRYAFVELRINGEVATLQPFDFFGETQLVSGYYTYQINTTNSTNRFSRISLTLVED